MNEDSYGDGSASNDRSETVAQVVAAKTTTDDSFDNSHLPCIPAQHVGSDVTGYSRLVHQPKIPRRTALTRNVSAFNAKLRFASRSTTPPFCIVVACSPPRTGRGDVIIRGALKAPEGGVGGEACDWKGELRLNLRPTRKTFSRQLRTLFSGTLTCKGRHCAHQKNPKLLR